MLKRYLHPLTSFSQHDTDHTSEQHTSKRNLVSCSFRPPKSSKLPISPAQAVALEHLGQLSQMERISQFVRKSLVEEFPDFKHDEKLKFVSPHGIVIHRRD